MDSRRVRRIREDMERQELMRLQPHYIQQFFTSAFESLGGKLLPRQSGLFEITHVPAVIRARDRQIGRRAPVQPRYERITFDKQHSSSKVAFVCPGHPLLDATLSVVLEQNRSLLRHGTVFINPLDDSFVPKALVALDHRMRDSEVDVNGEPRTISREVQFVTIDPEGTVSNAGLAPHIDYRSPSSEELNVIANLLDAEWLTGKLEDNATSYALQQIVPTHRDRVETERRERLTKTRTAVRQRLLHEINHWDNRAQDLKLKEEAGKQNRLNSTQAERRAEELQARLDARLAEVDRQMQISTAMPNVQAGALVVPMGLLNQLLTEHGLPPATQGNSLSSADNAALDRLAMEAVINAERQLGREPVAMAHNNPGYDIESHVLNSDGERSGRLFFIEVKGKTVGKDTVTISANQINFSFNKPDEFILAIVPIDNGVAQAPRYVTKPFDQRASDQIQSTNFKLSDLLERSTDAS